KKPFNNGEGAVERSLYLPFHPNEKAKKRGDTVPDLIVKSFEELAQAGHLVVLIYPIPEVGWHVPKLIKKKLDEIPRYPLNLKRKAFENMSITTNYDAYLERTAYTKSILDRVNHENIIRVNPDKLFCSEQSRRCVTHNESEIYYYDDDHLSQAGARLLVKAIASELNNNLLNKTNSKHLSLNR
ncbi:MAG: hypothetical protein GY702_12180, partial [Desulfobulbaceae bacterium]|nr:hypothetical protein [Desulfobulbaceae bacterium]